MNIPWLKSIEDGWKKQVEHARVPHAVLLRIVEARHVPTGAIRQAFALDQLRDEAQVVDVL